MPAISEMGKKVFVEMRVTHGEEKITTQEWAQVQVLDESQLVDILRERTGKSEDEVRRLLESYAAAK